MRAVEGSLGHSPKGRYRELEGSRPGKWHASGNRLRSNRREGRVRMLRAVGIIPPNPSEDDDDHTHVFNRGPVDVRRELDGL